MKHRNSAHLPILGRLLKADLRRAPAISLALLGIVTLVAALVSSSASILLRTNAAMSDLWANTLPADAVQMNSGDINEAELARIDSWFSAKNEVSDHQAIRTIPIPGSALTIAETNQADSVLEPAFVTQTASFDHLVGTDGQVLHPKPGQVALPVHYLATGQAKVGDLVTVDLGETTLTLEVIDFARDAQMNPGMVTSKRLLISEEDFATIDSNVEDVEYLIEFRTTDHRGMKAILDAYLDAGLPANGIAVEQAAFALMNGLTTLLVVAVAVFLALLLIWIAVLALRLAALANVEADLPDIATLKAIGAPMKLVVGMLGSKYLLVCILGALLGHLVAFPMSTAMDSTILLYLGTPETNWLMLVVPPIAALIITLIILTRTLAAVRKVLAGSPIEALRAAQGGQLQAKPGKRRWHAKLRSARVLPVTLWLGIRSALTKQSMLLMGVVAVATAIIALPLNVTTTFSDPRFATFLGLGEGVQVRIDVREGAADFAALSEKVCADSKVTTCEVLITQRWEMVVSDGSWESLPVESGDHTVFPLRFESGRAPERDSEIALSYKQADAVGVKVGDQVKMRPAGEATGEISRTVVGIYSDVTNGGRTAKVVNKLEAPALWQVLHVQLTDQADASAWAEALRKDNPGIKVSEAAEFTSQTTGAIFTQLRTVSAVAAVLALGIAFLVTSLTSILQIARESPEIAAQKALGSPLALLRRQYLIRNGIVLLIGVLVGLAGVFTLGRLVLAGLLGLMGAPGISFFINPILIWVVLPIAMAVSIIAATWLAARRLSAICLADAI